MGGQGLQLAHRRNRDVVFSSSGIKLQWSIQEGDNFRSCGLFASVGQAGMGLGISPNPPSSLESNAKLPYTSLNSTFVSMPEPGFLADKSSRMVFEEAMEVGNREFFMKKNKKKGGFKLKIKIGNPSLRRLASGAIAGAVSRTIVAPLETIKTHLMVGSCGHSTSEVFENIMKNEGWKGLFRGNLVNVIRVAPSKAIEVELLSNLYMIFIWILI